MSSLSFFALALARSLGHMPMQMPVPQLPPSLDAQRSAAGCWLAALVSLF